MRSVCVTSLLLLAACAKDTNLADSRDSGMDAAVEPEEAGADAGDAMQNGLPDAGSVLALCGTDRHRCQCSDGVDNDGDRQEDGFDSECTGPYDDDERTFALGTEQPGGNDKCNDCFYDSRRGFDDDGCRVAASCSFTPGDFSGGTGSCKRCDATPQCVSHCAPITPNGCDCFGCCEVLYKGEKLLVRLTASCSTAERDITNSARCQPCKLAMDCLNPCSACELCPGKTLQDLSAEGCTSLRPSCDGRTPCISPLGCSLQEFCSQGCCVPIVE